MSDARREAFWRIGETCPKVRDIIHHAVRQSLDDSVLIQPEDAAAIVHDLAEAAMDAAVIHGTAKLREALIECEEERLKAERERDDLSEEVDRLKRELENAEDDAKEAWKRANEAEAQVT